MAAKKFAFRLNDGGIIKVEAKEGVIMEVTSKGCFVDGRPPFEEVKWKKSK